MQGLIFLAILVYVLIKIMKYVRAQKELTLINMIIEAYKSDDYTQVEKYCNAEGISQEAYNNHFNEALTKLAEQENPQAMFDLANHLSDKSKREELLLRSAELGNRSAMKFLGLHYCRSMNDGEDDGFGYSAEKSFYWYDRAANCGDEFSMRQVAEAYYNGEGTEKDINKAFQYAYRLAKRGYPELTFFLTENYKGEEYISAQERIDMLYQVMDRKENDTFAEAASLLGKIYWFSPNISNNLRKAAYFMVMSGCLNGTDWKDTVRIIGYNPSQYELNSWVSDACNLRVNPEMR